MSTSIKQQELHAMNAKEPSSESHSLLEKHQAYSQEQDNQLKFPLQSLHVSNADMSTLNSYPNKLKISSRIYYGLQGQIYDWN